MKQAGHEGFSCTQTLCTVCLSTVKTPQRQYLQSIILERLREYERKWSLGDQSLDQFQALKMKFTLWLCCKLTIKNNYWDIAKVPIQLWISSTNFPLPPYPHPAKTHFRKVFLFSKSFAFRFFIGSVHSFHFPQHCTLGIFTTNAAKAELFKCVSLLGRHLTDPQWRERGWWGWMNKASFNSTQLTLVLSGALFWQSGPVPYGCLILHRMQRSCPMLHAYK